MFCQQDNWKPDAVQDVYETRQASIKKQTRNRNLQQYFPLTNRMPVKKICSKVFNEYLKKKIYIWKK